jgi:ubiquinone/menaquinone biosynthesis C-methylase UbiE
MKMGKFEKRFVNSSSHSLKVAEHAEKLLRLTPFVAGQKYLDFGCGNGAAALHLASNCGLEVTGIDVDPEQIRAAEAMGNGDRNARFLAIDGTKLPFGDGEFDFAATNMVTHHIPNWLEALEQMVRVLKPGGYFIYTDLAFPRWLAWAGSHMISRMGFPTVAAVDRFVGAEGLRPLHFSRKSFTMEGVWRKVRL